MPDELPGVAKGKQREVRLEVVVQYDGNDTEMMVSHTKRIVIPTNHRAAYIF